MRGVRAIKAIHYSTGDRTTIQLYRANHVVELDFFLGYCTHLRSFHRLILGYWHAFLSYLWKGVLQGFSHRSSRMFQLIPLLGLNQHLQSVLHLLKRICSLQPPLLSSGYRGELERWLLQHLDHHPYALGRC